MRCVFLLIYAIVCGMEIFDNILNEFHIENAYESWTEYRQYLTEWILASAEQIKNSIPEEELRGKINLYRELIRKKCGKGY